MKECPACRRCYPDHVNHCPQDGDPTTHSIAGEPVLDGRYQLERRLGAGGMGVVYKARHIFLKTPHAIKVILPDLVGNDPMLITRFRQEAMAAAAIRHPNIIAVTDFGVVSGTMPFLVMELVQGRSLHEILSAEGSLSPGTAFEIMSAIGAGVAAAHRQNIVHRDLKPLNIMIQDDLPMREAVKILDFGLAKIKSGEVLGSFIAAKTTGMMGSPYYMAPEQWSDEEPDARADIYSLGVMLYQMLAGDVPFKGNSIPAIMKKHLTEEPPPMSKLGIQIPSKIEKVIHHALEKEAAKRPASVEAFIGELREAVLTTSTGQLSRAPQEQQAPLPQQSYASGPISPSGSETTLYVRTHPSASRVFINNILVGTTDSVGDLVVPAMLPGLHHVRVVHQGYAEWERQIECGVGTCSIEAQLENLAATNLQLGRSSEAVKVAEEEAAHAQAAEREIAEARRKVEEERIANERAAREQKERVAQFARSVAAAKESMATPQAATQVDQTHGQRVGVTTQTINGDALGQAAVIAPPTQKRSPLLFILAAVFVVLAALGGGTYLWMTWKPSTGSLKGTTGDVSPSIPGVNPTAEPPNQTPPAKAEMVAIPGGAFKMGRDDGPPQETPAHAVTVAPFFIDKTEVSNAEYAQFVSETGHEPPKNWVGGKPLAGHEQMPVTFVSVEDAKAFAAWRSKRDGVQYRLPTEEEWEFASRGGDAENLYPWGNVWQEGYAQTKEEGLPNPAPVGSHPQDKSRWGVLDMLGSVYEWTGSKASLYPGSRGQIPTQTRDWYVVRGGSFASDPKTKPISGTYRDWFAPSTRESVIGFRLVRPAS